MTGIDEISMQKNELKRLAYFITIPYNGKEAVLKVHLNVILRIAITIGELVSESYNTDKQIL